MRCSLIPQLIHSQLSPLLAQPFVTPSPAAPQGAGYAPAPWAAKVVLRLLTRLEVGTLTVHLPGGSARTFVGAVAPEALHATLTINDWQVFARALRGGDIGFAECFIEGLWSANETADDLPALIALLAQNRHLLERAVYGSWLGQLVYRIKHWLKRNSKPQAQKNIHAHYDLGNDFYALMLDPSMTYSSALFDGDFALSLEAAQRAKYQRVLHELQLQNGADILEIGCGWGGFAQVALEQPQARVTGVTLACEQLAYANQRLDAFAERARLTLTDYRDLNTQFDGIASIEMFEAVGEAYWPDYFQCLKRCLKPGGRAVVQTITIADELFAQYRTGTDFIQQFIFPGGMLPSPEVFRAYAARAGLRVASEHAFGLDYAETLRRWRKAFLEQRDAVRALQPVNQMAAFDQRFLRTWEFYLAYCEGAFRARSTDVVQFTLAHA